MSVKTETHKPATGISLFDAFGPNVSEEVDAITQRAAELSMDDMVQVMGLPDSASKAPTKVKVETKSSLTLNTQDMLALLKYLEANQSTAVLSSRQKETGFNFAVSRKPSERERNVMLQMFNDPAILRGSTITPTHSRGGLVVKRAIESAADQLQKLLDEGVDRRSISIAIKYQDPESGLPRTRTVEDDSSGSAGAGIVFRKGKQVRKERSTVREHLMHFHPATSKK